ncbi:MAG: cytochrome c-type biogenesis protein CcmH [Burkholderiales bacterium]|nr:cytochrome c-type biogenesis protein CcmH [Burkholderiales bacterium]
MFLLIGATNLTLAQTPPTPTSPRSAPPKSTQPTVKDAALEKRVLLIAEELRCLVCQNQTIADSDADLAIDLREQIRAQLVAGRSDTQIMEFMVQRYGDFVRYRPPVKFSTAMLWFGPFLLLLAGAAVIFKVAQQRRRMTARKLTEAEEQRAQTLLEGSASAVEPGVPELPRRN